jgi:hypothetical protein
VTRRQGLPSCRHRGQMTFKAFDTGQTRCHARALDEPSVPAARSLDRAFGQENH